MVDSMFYFYSLLFQVTVIFIFSIYFLLKKVQTIVNDIAPAFSLKKFEKHRKISGNVMKLQKTHQVYSIFLSPNFCSSFFYYFRSIPLPKRWNFQKRLASDFSTSLFSILYSTSYWNFIDINLDPHYGEPIYKIGQFRGFHGKMHVWVGRVELVPENVICMLFCSSFHLIFLFSQFSFFFFFSIMKKMDQQCQDIEYTGSNLSLKKQCLLIKPLLWDIYP